MRWGRESRDKADNSRLFQKPTARRTLLEIKALREHRKGFPTTSGILHSVSIHVPQGNQKNSALCVCVRQLWRGKRLKVIIPVLK